MSDKLKERKEKVLFERKNGFEKLSAAEEKAMAKYCKQYMDFLQRGRTERLCVERAVELAEAAGFRPYQRGDGLKMGDKVYRVNRNKSVLLAVLGRKGLEEGCQITASHIDSPRLDVKPMPLYEDSELAYFKTHYYGGIRKYQWVARPLAIYGVVVLKDGKTVKVALGEGNEPRFVVTDLLPHLGAEQGKKPLNEAIPAESLNILLGSRPVRGEGSDRVKLTVMEKLNAKYGITEEDFLSAELEVVPAEDVTEIGLDGSMIGAYGHDDRVCGFAAFQALLDLGNVPEKTAVCMLADKEEIGSMGVSGMQSQFFDTFMEDLCDAQGVALRACYENAFCFSTDVTAAFDPGFADVYDKRNASFFNYGVALCKYTGARGKSGASDAGAETLGYIRRVLDDYGVYWQMAELGKADAGGGGTVAQFMANRNITTLDAGVPVLSMHAPFEVVSKLDCYMTYKGCKAVYLAD